MASDTTVVVKEIRDRNDAEIASLLGTKIEELHQQGFNHALGQLQETHKLKELRRDVARLRTVLNERKKGKETPA